MTEAIDLDHLRQWIGRTEQKTDIVTRIWWRDCARCCFSISASRRRRCGAVHGALVPDASCGSDVGSRPDGHPNRGGFLPPVPLPRRMWAGGAINFAEPLRVGES